MFLLRSLRSAVLAGGLALLASCHEQAPSTEQAAPTMSPTATRPQCYAYYTAQDTVRLTLVTTQPALTGQLIYRYFGKDRNQGTIRGTLRGDTLRADYTFQSEGIESVREVVFVRHAGGFAEGQGEMVDRRGKSVFTHPTALVFNMAAAVKPVACP
jgi:hypothetical protein